MEDDIRANYFAIIPAYIRYNKELKFGERLMYGEITALSNKEGYCYAKNKYFADLYNVSQSTISRWISHLAELNSIDVQIIRNDKKEIIERRIYIKDTPYMQNCIYPYTQNNQYPIRKKSKDNNINNNMLVSLYNYIIKKEKQIPDEFVGYEEKIIDVLNKFELIYPQEIAESMRDDIQEKFKTVCYALALAVKENVSHLLYKMNRDKLFSLYDECKLREQEYKNTDNEIISFTNYFYKSLKRQLLKSKGSSFFIQKNQNLRSESFNSEECEFLLEVKENLTNQLSCISDSFVSNIPNERFRDEWELVQEKLKVLNDILKDEKQKNLPEKVKNKIECRNFDFIDETFGEEAKNTLLFNSNFFVIISVFVGEVFIKKYEDILDLLKEFISNRNELLFLRTLTEKQQREIEDLEVKNNENNRH